MLIAQISDIHASADNDNIQRLGRVVSWLSDFRPDILVLSGDLVDDGWVAGYDAIKQALQRLACRSLILPGNADKRATMRAALPEVNYWHHGAPMHFAEPCGDALVIGLDVCVDGQAYGDVTAHLPWLETTLQANEQKTVLLFTHHHIFRSGIAVLDDVMCKGINALENLLKRSGRPPVAICSGHVHRPMAGIVAGVPAYICGSICPANPLAIDPSRTPEMYDGPSLMIHDLENGRLVSSHVTV